MQAKTHLTEDELLAGVPAGLRNELVGAYQSIVKNYKEGRWEPSELNGGKLSEVVYTILRGRVDGGTYPAKASKPNRFDDACRALESAGPSHPRSVRVGLPRTLMALYEVRNNRSVGHVGGDVDPNLMDATLVLSMAKWVVAELIRIFHGTDTAAATEAVESLSERTVPSVWVVGKMKRILNPSHSLLDGTLLLLYSSNGPQDDSQLGAWLEVSRLSNYKRVLDQAHADRLIEYSKSSGKITISPTGIARIEKSGLLS